MQTTNQLLVLACILAAAAADVDCEKWRIGRAAALFGKAPETLFSDIVDNAAESMKFTEDFHSLARATKIGNTEFTEEKFIARMKTAVDHCKNAFSLWMECINGNEVNGESKSGGEKDSPCMQAAEACMNSDPHLAVYSSDVVLWSGCPHEAGKFTPAGSTPGIKKPLVLAHSLVGSTLATWTDGLHVWSDECNMVGQETATMKARCVKGCGWPGPLTIKPWEAVSARLASRTAHAKMSSPAVFVLLKKFDTQNVFSKTELPALIEGAAKVASDARQAAAAAAKSELIEGAAKGADITNFMRQKFTNLYFDIRIHKDACDKRVDDKWDGACEPGRKTTCEKVESFVQEAVNKAVKAGASGATFNVDDFYARTSCHTGCENDFLLTNALPSAKTAQGQKSRSKFKNAKSKMKAKSKEEMLVLAAMGKDEEPVQEKP